MKRNVVIGLGEALWDVFPEGKKIGGAPANFAYHVSQFGLESAVVSAVGRDALGDEILENFSGKQLQCAIERVDYPTGTVQVVLDENGVPTYDIREGVAWDNIPLSPPIETLARRASAVCFGSLAQRSPVSRATIKRVLDLMDEGGEHVYKIFDVNLRQNYFTKERLEESMKRANVLKINDEEIAVVSRLFEISGIDLRDKCRCLIDRFGFEILILTCGVNGSYVFTPGEESFCETPRVEVNDTVGAGDSFTGAFCAMLLHGKTVREAHLRAVEVSAYVCTQAGAMPTLPPKLTEV